jgi:hypothetical protein
MSEVAQCASTDSDPWSQLWGQTVRPSWDLLGEDPVALALREHWEVQSAWMRDHPHIVDVGSGPAVLARLLQPLELRRDGAASAAQWTCVDQARIETSSLNDLPFVTGRFGLPWEALAPPDKGANALVSNFGLEYVSRDYLARACASWLARGGKLHAVMHARDSVIDRQSAQGLADLDLILDEKDFPQRVAALLEAKVSAPADPVARLMHGVDIRDAFNECVNHMKTRLEERAARQGALLEWLMLARDLVQTVSKVTLEASLERLKALRAAYDAERSRLTAMRSAALDQSSLEALGSDLASHGFVSIQLGSLHTSSGPAAWVLDALRSDGSPGEA